MRSSPSPSPRMVRATAAHGDRKACTRHSADERPTSSDQRASNASQFLARHLPAHPPTGGRAAKRNWSAAAMDYFHSRDRISAGHHERSLSPSPLDRSLQSFVWRSSARLHPLHLLTRSSTAVPPLAACCCCCFCVCSDRDDQESQGDREGTPRSAVARSLSPPRQPLR